MKNQQSHKSCRPDSLTIITANTLTASQEEDIRNMIYRCHKNDHSSLSYPLEQESDIIHYLACLGTDRLVSVLACYPIDNHSYECVAFTDPDFRQNGFFTSLFDVAMETVQDHDLFFVTDGACTDTLKALEALGAEPDGEEYQMELLLPCPLTAAPDFSLSTPSSGVWQLKYRDTFVGTCITELYQTSVCLHHVEIDENVRRQGFGTAMIALLSETFYHQGKQRIILHVSGSNTAAVALYQKTGFRITDSILYYFY